MFNNLMFPNSKNLFFVVLSVLTIFSAAAQSGTDLLAAGQVDDAISLLQNKISSAPSDAESHNLLCRAYFALGNWDRGIPYCEKAASLERSNSRYHLWLGRIYGEK